MKGSEVPEHSPDAPGDVVLDEPEAAGSPVATDRPSAGWQLAAGWYLGIGVVLLAVQATSIRLWGIKPKTGARMPFPGSSWLGGLLHWDGGWYTSIASGGYDYRPGFRCNVAFFPAYPLTMRALSVVVRNPVLAGIVVSAVSGLVASVGLWNWMGRQGLDDRRRSTALLVLLMYPYGFFLFGVVYSDALFLAVAVWVFVLAEARRWWWAGLLAVAATAGRPTGIAVTAGLLVLALEAGGTLAVPGGDGLLARWRVPVKLRWKRLRSWQIGPALLSSIGLVAFCWYLWLRWGDPLLFSSVQKYWGQPTGLATLAKSEYFDLMTHTRWSEVLTRPQTGLTVFTRTIQGGILLASLASIPFVGRRFGWGYATYALVALAIPLTGSKDFMGSGRYSMAAFPVLVLLGDWLSRRPVAVARSWLVVSALASATMMAFYAHGAYLS